jgi:predicted nucleic acid-binding protein
VKPAVQLDVVEDDPDDNKILECGSAASSEFIVTGDRHLLKLEKYDTVRILTVAEFLALM